MAPLRSIVINYTVIISIANDTVIRSTDSYTDVRNVDNYAEFTTIKMNGHYNMPQMCASRVN